MTNATLESSVLDKVEGRLFIGGAWVDAEGGKTLEVADPSTGDTIKVIADASPADGIKALDAAPSGTAWAVGTELKLLRRLALAHPHKQILFLDRTVCYCSTMNRIDLPHLVWALEELVAGRVPNQITVDGETARLARVALDQMLALP